MKGIISQIPVNCYQWHLMQNWEGSSWLPLNWELLWERGDRSSCLFHAFFNYFFKTVRWPGFAVSSLKTSHLLLSLALLPLVADHWSCPFLYSKNTGKIYSWNNKHGYLKEKSSWARRRYDFIKKFVSLTQKQKHTPAFSKFTCAQQIVEKQQAFSNTHTKENLQRFLRSWGGH